MTATLLGVDQLLGSYLNAHTARIWKRTGTEGGNPHREVYMKYTCLAVHEAPSGAFFCIMGAA